MSKKRKAKDQKKTIADVDVRKVSPYFLNENEKTLDVQALDCERKFESIASPSSCGNLMEDRLHDNEKEIDTGNVKSKKKQKSENLKTMTQVEVRKVFPYFWNDDKNVTVKECLESEIEKVQENADAIEAVKIKSKKKSKRENQKTFADIEVQKVSPYFQSLTGFEQVVKAKSEPENMQKLKHSSTSRKYCSASVKVSPYFQKVPKLEENAENQKTFTDIEVRKVSPYFQSLAGFEQVVKAKSEPENMQKLKHSSTSRKSCSASVKVSPYFQKVPKLEENAENQKTFADIEVRKVSPYFQSLKGFEQVVKAKNEPENMQKLKHSSTSRKSCSASVKVSPYFQKVPKLEENADSYLLGDESSCKAIKTTRSTFEKRDEAYKRRTPDNTWKPPRSEFGLLQEDHAHDPWRVLVICMLLNRTTGLQAGRVISDLFNLCSDAKTCTQVATEDIEQIIKSLGLQRKRAMMLQRFSREYLDESWTYVTQLHGVGKKVGPGETCRSHAKLLLGISMQYQAWIMKDLVFATNKLLCFLDLLYRNFIEARTSTE